MQRLHVHQQRRFPLARFRWALPLRRVHSIHQMSTTQAPVLARELSTRFRERHFYLYRGHQPGLGYSPGRYRRRQRHGPERDGTFYASTTAVNAAVERSINPNTVGQFYQRIPRPGRFPAAERVRTLEVVATALSRYPIIPYMSSATPTPLFPLLREMPFYTYQDTLVAAPAVTSPAAQCPVPTNVNFTWSPVTIPSTITVKYLPQIALDDRFQSYIYGGPGTSITGSTILPGNTL